MECREAIESGISALAGIRGKDPAAKENWIRRISGYINRTHNPRYAPLPRIIYVTEDHGRIVGFIAGHLTQRFDCEGELEWIDVLPEFRNQGIAATLLQHLAAWFIDRKAFQIFVDCAPDNLIAQNFYKKNGAEKLNEHWLVWKDISRIV